VLVKLADQELKAADVVVPFEDLFLTNDIYTTVFSSLRMANGDEKRRSSSTVSSSSSSSSTCSLSSTEGGVR
jgi:hypothetical protein